MMNTYTEKMSSGVAWLGDIPKHWNVSSLKRLLSEPLKYGATEAGDCNDRSLPRYLRITDFDKDGGLRADTFASLPEEVARDYFLKEGDVLFARSGATVGKTFLFRNYLGRACFAGYLIKASPARHKLTPEFLYYFTKSPAYEAWKNFIFTQATIQNIGADKYAYLPVCLPPVEEQQHIAAYLDASCAAIDAAVAAKRCQLTTIDDLRKVIISKAVTQGLSPTDKQVSSGKEWIGPVPAHWRLGKLKHLTSLIVDGTHITPTYLPSGVPFLRVTDIQEDKIDLNSTKFISEEEHTFLCQRSKAQRGDILLSKNGTIGITKVVDWDWEFSFFVSLCLLRPLTKLNPKYFQYFFESSVVDQQLFESSKKTSVTNLHLVKIRELLITVPPIKEQERIIQFLDEKCDELGQIKLNISEQIQRLQEYRKSLIHECVTGQRRITEEDVAQAHREGK